MPIPTSHNRQFIEIKFSTLTCPYKGQSELPTHLKSSLLNNQVLIRNHKLIHTPTPAKLSCPTKLTSTGKNAATSSPPTIKTNEPDFVVSAKGEMTGMDQASECEGGI